MNPYDHVPLKPDAFHILLVLLDSPCHGYALMRQLAQVTEGRVVLLPGALYRRLQHLLDDGLIEEAGGNEEPDSRRRVFAVTEFGHAVAEAEAERLSGLVEAARRRNLIKKTAEAEL